MAGGGAAPEAEALRRRMETMAPSVVMHGQLSQERLASLFRRSRVLVLPSFFEGFGLVLVEAFACGCRLVATRIPGLVDSLGPHFDPAMEWVALPRLQGVDNPVEEDIFGFVAALAEAMERALEATGLEDPALASPDALAPFTWSAVFERVESVWRSMVG